MATNPTEFAAWMASYAQQASAATGLDPQLIIAQWGNETAWGTEFAQSNNIGNVGVYSGGPNPSYPTLEAGVQAYINEMNSPAMAKAKTQWQGQDAAAQAAILGNSGYAGGGYNNGSGPGSDLIADMAAFGSNGTGTAAPDMTAQDWQALAAAGAAGGTSYLESAANQSAATNAASSSPNATSTTNAPAQSVVIGGQTYTTPAGDPNASTQVSALGQMAATLASYGFSGSDLQNLTSWAWTEMTGNVDPSQIAIDMQTPGSVVYPIFEKQFPGFTAANQELTGQGLPAVSVSQYQSTQTSYQGIAQAAGLPPGFVTSQDIGTLIGGNVSPNEFNARVNNAVALAYNSTPEQQAEFNQYFGTQYDANNPYTAIGGAAPSGHGPLTAGQIAAIALDPTKAEPLIAQQVTAAQIGGASVTSGVGSIDAATATQLAQAGVTEDTATKAFQGLAPLSALETARPGMGGEAQQGVVTADQIATGNLLGDPAAQRQEQTAIEVGKAPFTGGGGYVSTSKGTGVGSANPNGTGNA